MRKNGKIPPHFLYFLEDEGIEITDFRSSNFAGKDSYDRVVVKFPYSVKTIDIQVIFDNLDYSFPPDFVLIKDEKLLLNYEEIIKDWNFKESSSLFASLNKIKEFYSNEQEKKFKEDLKNSQNSNVNKNKNDSININQFNEHFNYDIYHPDTTSIFEYVDMMIKKIKTRFNTYKQIPKSSCILEILLNHGSHSSETKDKFTNHIVLSYPIDFYIRSRNINRAPIVNILIPITYDMKFYLDVKTPHFVSVADFKVPNEFYDLKDFFDYITKFESLLIDYFKEMQIRETVINKILDANLGFPLEIDTFSFSKFSLYFHYNSNMMSLANSSMKGRGVNLITPGNGVPLQSSNFLLYFVFAKDDKKLEFHIINIDLLRMIVKMKFDYSAEERDVSNILHSILNAILESVQLKKK